MLSIFINPNQFHLKPWITTITRTTRNSEVPEWNQNFYFCEQFLCQISPLVHPPVRKKNLDHMYIGKYALWFIGRPIKCRRWPQGAPLDVCLDALGPARRPLRLGLVPKHIILSMSHITDLSRQIWSCLKYYLLRVDQYDVISLREDHQEQTHHLWSVC